METISVYRADSDTESEQPGHTIYNRLNLHEDVEEVCNDMSTQGGMLNAVRSEDFD